MGNEMVEEQIIKKLLIRHQGMTDTTKLLAQYEEAPQRSRGGVGTGSCAAKGKE
jgi:hypothetical protein